MLVLSRKVGEQIVVGDGIVITVVRMGQGSVRIGVEAPTSENRTAGPTTTDATSAVTPADTLSFFI